MGKEKLYFIAVMPPADIQEEVTKLKQHFKNVYNTGHALKSPPHITLIPPFKITEEKEKDLITFLDKFSESLTDFEIRLIGFGAFPPRVIYLKISDEKVLRTLFEKLVHQIDNKIKVQIRNPDRFNAHMTLATRDLSKENFKKAWSFYREGKIDRRFTIDKIVLLKHNGRFWDTFHQSFFGNN